MDSNLRVGSRFFWWLGSLCLLSLVAGCKFPTVGYNQGYSPVQPIPFSHQLHAGQYKIQCLYCHTNAIRSNHATVPSLNICMNCHIQVATDKPDIQKIQDAYNNNKPIVWTRVHMLPDFVHFNHRRHVRFGLACQTCHGPVETMKRVYQWAPLSMGWCINCHRLPQHHAPTSCSTCHY